MIEPYLANIPHAPISAPQIVIPGDTITFASQSMTEPQLWASMYLLGVFVSYGRLEYSDIFGRTYIVDYCRQIDVEWLQNKITWTLPHKLSLPCEKRTTVETKEK